MAITLTATTSAAALGINGTLLTVASASGISAPVNNIRQQLYLINPESTRGELVDVLGVNGVSISISRNSLFRQAYISGATVIIGVSPTLQSQGLGSFYETDPVGAVTAAQVPVTPFVNVTNGNQWLRSVDGLWVPGFNNPAPTKGVTDAVASVAGATAVSGPLFHVTGTNAVTGWTIPVGFAGGSFSVIPDGNFTWTTAGNIGLAGTAVTGRVLTFTWDSNAGKFFPSYV